MVTSPNAAGASNALLGVSAVAANDIWAVGYSDSSTLIEHWNGIAWSIVPSPNVGTFSRLQAVAAVSANDVWAVGFYNNGGYPNRFTLIQHWNGTAWTVVSSPSDSGANSLLRMVVISANDIWAVGYHGVNPDERTMFLHWNGVAWSQAASPPNVGAEANLVTNVSAVSATDVWAVGYTCPAEPTGTCVGGKVLTYHWNGTAWSNFDASSANIGGTGSTLPSGIAAVSANDIWAVGRFKDSASTTLRAFVMHWNGTSWTASARPQVGTLDNRLNTVRAGVWNDLWAVGQAGPNTLTNHYACVPEILTPTPTVTPTSPPTHTPSATPSRTPTTMPTQQGVDNAVFVTQLVPGAMSPGQVYDVSVTMRNIGTSTWVPGLTNLGSQNPQDNETWGLARVALPDLISPGDTATFRFTVTAPASTGTYNFRWRMVHEGVDWFGENTTNVIVNVTSATPAPSGVNNATFVTQVVPFTVAPGHLYNASITMKNSGFGSWTPGSHKLGSQNPQDNGVWGLSRIALPTAVPAGGQVTFNFMLQAPTAPGTYNFQWRMLQEGVDWFGEYTANVAILVSASAPTPTVGIPTVTATATSVATSTPLPSATPVECVSPFDCSITPNVSDMPVGLVGLWPMNGDVQDVAGGHDGVMLGQSAIAANRFLSINGRSGSVSMADTPALDLLQSGSINLWLYLVETVDGRSLLAKGTGDGNQASYAWTITDGTLRFTLFRGDGSGNSGLASVSVPSTDIIGAWRMLTVTWDGAQLRLYVQGVLRSSTPYSFARLDTPYAFQIGTDSGGRLPINVRIDDLQAYNRALSPSDLQALMSDAGANHCRQSAYDVNPAATFLRAVWNDAPANPRVIDLAAVGLSAGDLVRLSYDVADPGFSFFGCSGSFVLENGIPFLGVFSSSSTLLGQLEQFRVPGAIDAGTDAGIGPVTSGEPADIPEDFRLLPPSGLILEVPAGATHLFLGMGDSYYADNCGVITVMVEEVCPRDATPSVTPPPAFTPTPSSTPTPTLTRTTTPAPTATLTPSITPRPSNTPTPTLTPTITPTPSGPPPVASIGGLEEGERITAPVDITGTVDSATMESWTLDYRLAGESDWTILESNNNPVINGTLATFDPTLLLNGIYEVRLSVRDVSGRSDSSTVNVVVDGAMKLGNFSLSFTDFEMPIAGIPIQIIRSYDSRDKRRGDFGVGWTLGTKDLRVQENGVLGQGWNRTQQFVTFCVEPARPHIVTIAGLDGNVSRFRASVEPACQGFSLPPETTVYFEPLPGTYGSLGPIGPVAVVSTGDGVELRDPDTLDRVDPSIYTFTSRGGTELEIEQGHGVRRITDLNGNTLTFDASGITHSAGAGVPFERDAAGRITRITDPQGNHLDYAYDASGDLISVIDREGNATTFSYDATHRLLSATDPLGNVGLRTEFDDDGRMTAAIDASGKRIEFDHDVLVHQELVTDRRGNVTIVTYDSLGRVVSRRLPDGGVHSFTYDSVDNLLSETDPSGATKSYTYDAAGNVTSQTDALGNTTTSTYDDAGRVTSVTNALGHSVDNTYDARGNLTSTTDPLGHEQSFSYDARGNLLTRTDPLGRTTASTYDAVGNELSITDALGRTTDQSYDDGNQLTHISGPGGREVDFAYDANKMTTAIDLGGEVTGMGYDAAGRPTTITNALGYPIMDAFDAQGRRTAMTLPNGASNQYGYDDEGNRIAETDPLGNVTHHEYDERNLRVRTVFPDGSDSRSEYDSRRQLTRVIDQRGNATRFEYDAAGRQTRIIDALGGVTTREYDAIGRMTFMTDTLGHRTSYEYDAAGRPVRTVRADGSAEHTEYDDAGQVVRTIDAAGHATNFAYDDVGSLLTVTDALGNITTYEYDDRGNRTAIIDANGHRTTFEYDTKGRLTKTTYPLGDNTQATYRTGGAVDTSTNGNGQVLRYSYNEVGARVDVELPDGTQEVYAYAPDGRVTRVTDARGLTRYDYHALTRRLARVTEPDGRYVRYAYDAAGNRTVMAHAMSDGQPETVLTYDYDALNRMTAVTDTIGATTFDYDASGNLLRTHRPNGTVTETDYDTLNRVTEILHRQDGGTVLERFQYEMDPVGNRTAIHTEDGARVEYGYDTTYKVTAERHYDGGGDQVATGFFTYDAAGNLVSKAGTLGTVSRIFNANSQLVSSSDGRTYTYDGAGNLIGAADATGVRRYRYDARNRMIRFEPATGASTDYKYDPEGIRQSKIGSDGGLRYLIDRQSPTGNPQVIRETTFAGSTRLGFTHGLFLLARHSSTSDHFYHSDALGSTRLRTDEVGARSDQYAYTAYGTAMGTAAGSDDDYRFAGEAQDGETGFYYLRARYLDLESGVFTTRDPMDGSDKRPMTWHQYAYANDNPVNVVDPAGTSGIVGIVGVLKQRLATGTFDCDGSTGDDCARGDLSWNIGASWHPQYAMAVEQARMDGANLAALAVSALSTSGDGKFLRYFASDQDLERTWSMLGTNGTMLDLQRQRQQVQTNFDLLRSNLQYLGVSIDIKNGSRFDVPSRVAAAADFDHQSIRIYQPFWTHSRLPLVGRSTSRAGIMLHEFAHLLEPDMDDPQYLAPWSWFEGDIFGSNLSGLRNADSYTVYAAAVFLDRQALRGLSR